jgi:hypothetical protein
MVCAASAGGCAEEAKSSVDSVLEWMNLKTDPGHAPDFVQQSRPAGDSSYIPVGQTHPTRTVKPKKPAEIKASEAELDSARAGQERKAGQVPVISPPAAPTPPKKRPTAALRGTQN